MVDLAAVVRFLDEELRTAQVPDSDAALNGLQLANEGRVSRIAAAVDFAEQTVTAAVREGADLLVVHHGMFWRSERLVGAAYRRLRDAVAGGLAVYSSHIPLDLHPALGNNALLARTLGLDASGTFGRYRGVEIGVCGSCDLTTTELFDRVREFSARHLTTAVATTFPERHRTRQWAIVTGSGASTETVEEASEKGIDTLIVGEGPHHTAVHAMEAGVVVMYAGHYATETLGVRALAEMLSTRFDVPWVFIDAPTGL